MSQSSALIQPGVTGYELDDDTVLFLENTGELLRLNPTAALVWRGLASGLSSRDIVESLVQVLDAPAVEVERDVAELMTSLREAGVLGGSPMSSRTIHAIKMATTLSEQSRSDHPQLDLRERCYRLVDFRFRLRMPSAIEASVDQLLAHLSLPESCSPEVLLEVLDDGNQWLLVREGQVVDQCSTAAGVVPMLHASILLMAYWSSGCMAGLHAAAVTNNGDDCIVMPAVSGRGKSTLTAALISQGFGYCTDDLALLTHEPIRIRPVPTCLGLKPGSWGVLDDVFPAIRHLPTHLRTDGKQVRYLPPSSVNAACSYKARAIVFPVWSPGHTAEIQRISSAEGLSRLASAGYDLRNRINRDIVECLIRWIADIPSFELQYDLPTDVAPIMSALMQ